KKCEAWSDGDGSSDAQPSMPSRPPGAAAGTALSAGAGEPGGANDSGALGNGTHEPNLTPMPVSGLGLHSGVVAIAAGADHTLALKADGTVWVMTAQVEHHVKTKLAKARKAA